MLDLHCAPATVRFGRGLLFATQYDSYDVGLDACPPAQRVETRFQADLLGHMGLVAGSERYQLEAGSADLQQRCPYCDEAVGLPPR